MSDIAVYCLLEPRVVARGCLGESAAECEDQVMSQISKAKTANLLKVCEKTVERMVNAGRLTPIKTGKTIHFDFNEVMAVYREREAKNEAA